MIICYLISNKICSTLLCENSISIKLLYIHIKFILLEKRRMIQRFERQGTSKFSYQLQNGNVPQLHISKNSKFLSKIHRNS